MENIDVLDRLDYLEDEIVYPEWVSKGVNK